MTALLAPAWRPTTVRGERRALTYAVLAVVLLPLLKPSGPGNTAAVDVFVAAAIVTAVLWLVANRLPITLPYARPVAVLAFAGLLAATLGALPMRGLMTVVQDGLLLALCGAVANVARRPGALATIVRAWVKAAIGWGLLLVVGGLSSIGWLSGVNAHDGSRASLTFGDPNYAANYFVVSLFLILASRYPRRGPTRLLAVLLMMTAVFLTGSNGGLVSLLIGAGAGAFILLGRRYGLVTLVGLAALVAVVGFGTTRMISLSDVQDAARSIGRSGQDSIGRIEGSASSRSTLFHQVVKLYRDGPVLGRGPASTKASLRKTGAPYAKEAHSDYTATLAERGIIGWVGLVLLIGAIAVRMTGLITRRALPAFAEAVPTPEWLAAALVAFVVAAGFYEVLHFRHLWALLGVVAALHAFGLERERHLGGAV